MTNNLKEIPWDDERGMIRAPQYYPYGFQANPTYPWHWRENFTFADTLEIENLRWTYSKGLNLVSGETQYSMFMADFERIVLAGVKVENRKISGVWSFRKRGQYYGVYLVGAE